MVEKIEAIDVAAIGNSVRNILDGTDKLVNKPVDEAVVTDLEASLRALRGILSNVEDADLDATVSAAREALINLQRTLSMINDVLDPHSPLQYNVIKVTEELEEMSRSIRSLIETLQRQPNAVIFGKKSTGDEQ